MTSSPILTTKGPMDPALLKKQAGLIDNDVERTISVEYWLGGDSGCDHYREHSDPTYSCRKCPGELVHRSVDMKLKKPAVFAEGVAANLT